MDKAMTDQQLDAYCKAWATWCYTRKYYVRPGGKNILARMQPSRSGIEPNARNDPDMQFFNMAIHTLADMKEYVDGMVCFTLHYLDHPEYVKVEAAKLQISRVTYYNRVKAFARRAYSMSHSLKRVHESLNAANEAEAEKV